MCEMYDLFPNFNFVEKENSEDPFHDLSHEASQSLVQLYVELWNQFKTEYTV